MTTLINEDKASMDIPTLAKFNKLLQPITPTDKDHGAVWWNENMGKSIRAAQEKYISQFTSGITKCGQTNKSISDYINNFKPIKWPSDESIPDFWSSSFGIMMLSEWSNMWYKYFAQFASIKK